MIRRLIGAVQFLTVLPLPGNGAPPEQAALFYPLVGAAIGAAGGALFSVLTARLPAGLAAALVIAAWVLLTGALHEDGLADCADAIRKDRPPEKILAILKDSRIGAFGALALVLGTLIRWQALTHLAAGPAWLICAVAHAVPRAGLVLLAYISRPLGAGTAARFSAGLTSGTTAGALLLAVAAAAPAGLRFAWFALASSLLLVFMARRFFYARAGGVNGDMLGAYVQTAEGVILVGAACAPFSW